MEHGTKWMFMLLACPLWYKSSAITRVIRVAVHISFMWLNGCNRYMIVLLLSEAELFQHSSWCCRLMKTQAAAATGLVTSVEQWCLPVLNNDAYQPCLFLAWGSEMRFGHGGLLTTVVVRIWGFWTRLCTNDYIKGQHHCNDIKPLLNSIQIDIQTCRCQ